MRCAKYMNYVRLIGAAFLLLHLSSCSDFTELQPKGKNVLSTVDQLETLLNYEYAIGGSDWTTKDMRTMCNDIIYAVSPVSTAISQPNKSRDVIMWTWDESSLDLMAQLTATDEDYDEFYGIIGTICNPVLPKIDEADGADVKKRQIRCEALTLRALCHYIMVNKFAAAYNPATAATTRGIIVMTEDVDITVPQEQKTLQEVYGQILADVNEAIELDGLPQTAVNRERMSKPCPYAIKALVMASMQQWDEAEKAAKQALAIDGTLVDLTSPAYERILSGLLVGGRYPVVYKQKCQFPEDYFFTYAMELFSSITPQTQQTFEEGNVNWTKMGIVDMGYDYMMNPAQLMIGEPDYVMTYDMESGWNTAGLRVPQMYLIVAEAEIHKGNITEAMHILDQIRVKRIASDTYRPLEGAVTSETEAIAVLKQTSLAENYTTYYSFIDKKRWNQVKGWEETFTRTLAGKTYELRPDSKMWIFPFPMNVVSHNPNIIQNYK